ncbi:RNA-directed DNA polymerase (reverse transcriptase)-related family protein, partial [Thalictrum thalictroides]
TFILPVTVLDSIAKKCAAFLWNGPDMGNKMHQANLHTICLPKDKGGLGITDLKLWNEAAYLGLVFKVVSKESSIWVDWVWAQHLRTKKFWTMDIPQDCSWVWRSILHARVQAAVFIKYILTNGATTSLWHDLWCSLSPLWKHSEARRIWGSSFHTDATVAELITHHQWNDRVLNLTNSSLKQAILKTEIFSNLPKDEVIWKLTSSGNFSTRSTYRGLHTSGSRVRWHRLVWGKLVLPKHSFTCWQAFSHSLQTLDRLKQKHITDSTNCFLCPHNRENTKHLFFECPYSKQVWNKIKLLLSITTDERTSNWEWRSIFKLCVGQSTANEVLKAYVCAVVHNLWMERNYRKHNRGTTSPEALAYKILREMKLYLQTIIDNVLDTGVNKSLLERIGLVITYKHKDVVNCSWDKPEQDFFKLNCDGALNSEGAGYGGLIRDKD